MTWKTHVIGGAQAGLIAAHIAGCGPVDSAVIMTSAVLGSVLPDIDHPRSKIAKCDSLVGLVSHALSRFTKHRGLMHTLPGAVLVASVFYLLAMFRTQKESLLSFFAAFTVFLFMHAVGGILRRLAGWTAVLAYSAGPQIADLLSSHNAEISLNEQSARVCAIGIFAGCISHMIYDTFNSGGIMWLFPLSRRNLRIAEIRTDSLAEFGFAAVQVVVISILLAVFFKDAQIISLVERFIEDFAEISRSLA